MPLIRVFGLAIAKSLSKLFGLATITFFGRVPSRDDDKVGAMGLLSITWYVVLAAIVFPPIGELVFPFLDDEQVIRWLAVLLAVTVPPVVGFLVTRMHNRRDERGAAQVARELLFGYGYSVILGGLVLALIIVVPVVKGSYIVRRFDLKHIAVLIDGPGYEKTLEAVRGALARHELETEVRQPHWTIYRIFTWLAWLEGHVFRREVADEMQVLRGRVGDEKFEVTLHATDISILGTQHATTVVMSILGEELTEEHLYFTWDDEAQEVEDRIRELRAALEQGGPELPDEDDVAELADRLRDLSLEAEEWNAVRRQLYMLQIQCLHAKLQDQQPDGGRPAGGEQDGGGPDGGQPDGGEPEVTADQSSTSSSGSSAISSSSSGSSSPRT
jgi:hypothetical protein